MSSNSLFKFFKKVESVPSDDVEAIMLGKRADSYMAESCLEESVPVKILSVKLDQLIHHSEPHGLTDDQVAEELLGDSFDSLPLLEKYSAVQIDSLRGEILPKDFKWLSEDDDKGGFIYPNISDEFSYADNKAYLDMKAYIETSIAANETNPCGYHLIFPYKFISDWKCDRVFNSVSVVWGLDQEKVDKFDDTQFRMNCKKLPNFLAYLCSDSGFLLDVIAKMNDEGSTDVKPQQPILHPDTVFYWALEGYDASVQSENPNKLHYHVIALYPTTFNPKRAPIVRGYFFKYLNALTVSALRSPRQLTYIFKERFLFGACWRTEGVTAQFFSLKNDSDFVFDVSLKKSGYAVCAFCSQTSDLGYLKVGSSFGWDLSVLSSVSRTADFIGVWKKPSDFTTMLEDKSEHPGFCSLRLRESFMWMSKRVIMALVALGLSNNEAVEVMTSTAIIFTQFRRDSNCAGVFRKLKEWITQNSHSDAGSKKTFRVVLALGGEGGSGKTTLAQMLHRGISMPYEILKMGKEGQVGRGNHGGVSLIRFYDEVEGNSSSRQSIFARFTFFENAESRMFTPNVKTPAFQYNIAASANIERLPSQEDFVKIEGAKSVYNGTIARDYQTYLYQAKRRFLFVTLTPQTFIEPYLKFFGTIGDKNGPRSIPRFVTYILFI